jgi:hypothetical protein
VSAETRHTGRAVLLLAIGMLLVLAVAAPAEAKGPTMVSIEGPGLTQPIVLGRSTTGILFFESGAADELGACLAADRCSPHPPQGDLGPKYVATYTVMYPNPSGREVNGQLVQYLYPQARPMPLAYLPPGQPYGGARTVGGTFPVGETMLSDVIGHGFGSSALSSPVSAAQVQAATSTSVLPGVVAAIAILAVAFGAVVWIRRRGRPTPARP